MILANKISGKISSKTSSGYFILKYLNREASSINKPSNIANSRVYHICKLFQNVGTGINLMPEKRVLF